jgi:type I restriction enzyme R subunit
MDSALSGSGVDAMNLAREIDALLKRFPTLAANVDEQRRFRASLYKPLLALSREERARVVESVMKMLQVDGEQ